MGAPCPKLHWSRYCGEYPVPYQKEPLRASVVLSFLALHSLHRDKETSALFTLEVILPAFDTFAHRCRLGPVIHRESLVL